MTAVITPKTHTTMTLVSIILNNSDDDRHHMLTCAVLNDDGRHHMHTCSNLTQFCTILSKNEENLALMTTVINVSAISKMMTTVINTLRPRGDVILYFSSALPMGTAAFRQTSE